MATEEQKTYSNHTLKLTEDWRIEVVGPHFPESLSARDRIFDALTDARHAIDKAIVEKNREDAALAASNLRIRVFDSHGNLHTVERIDRRDGRLHGIPDNSIKVYPAIAWIGKALARLVELRREASQIDTILEPLAMRTSRTYSRVSVDELPNVISKLVKEHEDLTAKANGMKEIGPTLVADNTTKKEA